MTGPGEKQATYRSRCRRDTFTPLSLEPHRCPHITHNPPAPNPLPELLAAAEVIPTPCRRPPP
jgi:hypothetical protein